MDKYGLIGYPLGHSFSKSYFNEKFENEGIDAQYINFEIPIHRRSYRDSRLQSGTKRSQRNHPLQGEGNQLSRLGKP